MQERHLYNLYYKRPDNTNKDAIIGEGRRLILRTHKRKFNSGNNTGKKSSGFRTGGSIDRAYGML